MARIKLKTKNNDPPETTEKHVIKKKHISADHSYIAINDPINFGLLTDNRCEDEKFSRIDKFFVNHYYLVGTEWLCEKLFYPSGYGFEEISKEENHPFNKRLNDLRENGVGLWGERPQAQIYKPIKRIELKTKPKRMKLNAKT